jgi:integrase
MAGRRTKRSDGRFASTSPSRTRTERSGGSTFMAAPRLRPGSRWRRSVSESAAANRCGTRPERCRTLAEWRTTFLRASYRAESTKDLYAGLTVGHVEPVIGHLALGQVKPSDITRVLLRMEQLGRAASTRRSAYAVLRSAFEDAVIDGLLGASPVLRVKRPRATHGEATSLEPEQVAQLLQGAEDLRYARVLRLILRTGLRRGEALALRWADVRLDRRELSIKGSLTRRGSELVVSDAKTQRSRRVVSLSPAM